MSVKNKIKKAYEKEGVEYYIESIKPPFSKYIIELLGELDNTYKHLKPENCFFLIDAFSYHNQRRDFEDKHSEVFEKGKVL